MLGGGESASRPGAATGPAEEAWAWSASAHTATGSMVDAMNTNDSTRGRSLHENLPIADATLSSVLRGKVGQSRKSSDPA